MKVQALLFDQNTFTSESARVWANKHKFNYRLIQKDSRFVRLSDINYKRQGVKITIADGVQALIAKDGAPAAPVSGPTTTSNTVHVNRPLGSEEDLRKDVDHQPNVQNTDVEVSKDFQVDNWNSLQSLIEGMDHELTNGTMTPVDAMKATVGNLSQDPMHYKANYETQEDPNELSQDTLKSDDDGAGDSGLSVDLGSGQFREPGSIGFDLYPHDHGTIVHDLSLGIPLADQSVSKMSAVNSMHEMDLDPKDLLAEIQRCLKPGGQFAYQGPTEITDLPDQLVQTDHESNEDEIDKSVGTPTYHQIFTRVGSPDAATANDSQPRVGVDLDERLPEDALLAANQMGSYWSDASTSSAGNRLHGYPSQGGAFNAEVDKGGPGSGPQSGKGKTPAKGKGKGKSKPHAAKHPAGHGAGHHEAKGKGGGFDPYGAAGEVAEKSSVQKTMDKILMKRDLVPIAKADSAKQIVYGVVLPANEVDLQDDWMAPEDIEEAAHHYMQNSRVVGSQHEKAVKAQVVESYIAPQDLQWDDGANGPQTVAKGSWIMAVKIADPDEWAKVLDGEYTGFSVGGLGVREN